MLCLNLGILNPQSFLNTTEQKMSYDQQHKTNKKENKQMNTAIQVM
jgi:hypothetical protein